MIAGVTAIVTAGLLLVNFLDHPYAQHTGSIRPTEMRQSLAMMRDQAPSLLPACDAQGRPTSTA